MDLPIVNIDEIAHASGADRKKPKQLKNWKGIVTSTSPFKVAPLGTDVGIECETLCNANVGAYVYVLKSTDGHNTAIGKVGGGGGGGGGGGTDDYNELNNKPTITEPVYGSDPVEYSTVTIRGDKTFDELGMHPFTNQEIEDLLTIADAS